MIIGVDIGGTKTWVGRFDNNGLLKSRKIRTATKPLQFLTDLTALMQQFLGKDLKKLTGIGIGAPGPIDIDTGSFDVLPNLPLWKGFGLKAALEDRYHVPVLMQNDANAGALGEALFGGGKDFPLVYYITMSTGIGGGLVMDGKIINGKNDLAGEIWSLPVMNMGKSDILINGASGPGIVKNYVGFMYRSGFLKSGDEITSKGVFDEAKRGDPAAVAVLKNCVDCMAEAVRAILHIVDPDVVLFGGGLVTGHASLVEQIRKTVHQNVFFEKHAKTPIERAVLGEDSVLYGALSLFQQ